MKRVVFAVAFTGLLLGSVYAEDDQGIHLHEVGITAGYGWADLKPEKAPGQTQNQDDYAFYPIIGHFGYKINSWFDLETHPGVLQLAVQPFVNPVINPDGGVEVGTELALKYSYPVWKKVSPFVEIGVGPMYFGVDTYEQGEKGFSFSDHVAGGFEFHFADNKSFNVGHRYRHISNLNTREENGGISGNVVTAGFSIFY